MITWKIILTAIVVTPFILLAVIGAVYFGLVTRNQVREEYAPPKVIVTNPSAGSTHPAGMVVEVSATVMGFYPFTQVELGLDGVLMESRSSEQTAAIKPFYVDFGFSISESAHYLVIRAINTRKSWAKVFLSMFWGSRQMKMKSKQGCLIR